MIYERLDRGCKAKVLSAKNKEVLMVAFWPATKHDLRKFQVVDGKASNTIVVSKGYFKEKYGVAL